MVWEKVDEVGVGGGVRAAYGCTSGGSGSGSGSGTSSVSVNGRRYASC